jgi:hypothetical protein
MPAPLCGRLGPLPCLGYGENDRRASISEADSRQRHLPWWQGSIWGFVHTTPRILKTLGPVEGPHSHHTSRRGRAARPIADPERGGPSLPPDQFESVLSTIRLGLLAFILDRLIGFLT